MRPLANFVVFFFVAIKWCGDNQKGGRSWNYSLRLPVLRQRRTLLIKINWLLLKTKTNKKKRILLSEHVLICAGLRWNIRNIHAVLLKNADVTGRYRILRRQSGLSTRSLILQHPQEFSFKPTLSTCRHIINKGVRLRVMRPSITAIFSERQYSGP